MSDYCENMCRCAATEADSTIENLKSTMERNWHLLSYFGVGQQQFLCKVLSRALTEVSSEDGDPLRGSDILSELKREGEIAPPGIVSDHAKWKLKTGNMVLIVYRKRKKVRLRVWDSWPGSALSTAVDVDAQIPNGCSAEECVQVIKAFRDSYDVIYQEYRRVCDFFGISIFPKMKKLLEIEAATREALKK